MPEPSTDPLVGRLVAGRYRVLRPLGEGGMGQVYLAEHEAIEKKIALKVLRPEFSRKEDIVTRFQQEAISASRIKHPNVLEVFDFGRLESGEAFLAMEFLEGHDLSEELSRTSVLHPARAVPIAMQICRALAAAHSRGVVHRDMKPDNVFLQRTADGEIVKIVDFGIAQLRSNEEAAKSQPRRRRLTKTGMIFGTPEYMAPEQAGGRQADHRVDVYAVGVILYEMFTGAVPFTGDSFIAVLSAAVHEPPPLLTAVNPDLRISVEMQGVIMRALSKNASARFASMNDFMAAILATPEGATYGRSTGSIPHSSVSSAPHGPSPAPTAAQFGATANTLVVHEQSGGTLVSPVDTAALGTPPTRVASDSGKFTASVGTPRTLVSPENSPVPTLRTDESRTLVVPEAQASNDPHDAPVAAPSRVVPGESRPAVTSAPVDSGSSKLGLVGAAIVVAAIGGYFVYSRATRTEDTAARRPGDPPRGSIALVPEPALIPAAASVAAQVPPLPVAVASAQAPTNDVTLHVVTEPPGAILLKAGFQVCDATPCDIVVGRNDPIELEAQKSNLKGRARILAQHAQTVTIALVAPQSKPKAPAGPRMCEVEVEGLKILRPCAQ